MEGLKAHGSDTSVLPTHGIKRRASLLEPLDAKKARGYRNESDCGMSEEAFLDIGLTTSPEFDASDFEQSDDSCYMNCENEAGSSAATPLTPISPKPSPRHPSDLNKNHQCSFDDCKKSFNRPAKLAQHIRSHTNTRPFICPHAPCTKDFLRESHLKHHIKSAHSGVRDFICEWEGCGKTFITATRLRRHHAAHEGREKFRCTIADCGQTFRKHGTLQRHIITLHEGQDPFKCAEVYDDGQGCGVGFNTEKKLKSHIGRVHRTKTFICTICSLENDDNNVERFEYELEMIFPSHAALQAHMTNEHPPTCTVCGLKCTSQSALKSHTEVIHGELSIDERRTHICPEPDCGLGFTKKGNLNAHIQISHAGKRFICGAVDPRALNNVGVWDGSDACGEPSTSKRNLERHIRGVHLGLEFSGKAKTKGTRREAEGPSRKNEVSVLTRLTGSGYDTESGRHITCLIEGCDHHFTRDYDLEIHLQSRHGATDNAIRGMLAKRDSHSQSTMKRLPQAPAAQGFDASSGLSMQFINDVEMDGFDETVEAVLHRGEDFWLGGQSDAPEYYDYGWMHNAEEMQRVVVGSQRDVEMVDPSLR